MSHNKPGLAHLYDYFQFSLDNFLSNIEKTKGW